MSSSDFNIKFGVDTKSIKSELEKFRDYKLNIDIETEKLKSEIKEVFKLGDSKKDIQTIDKLYREFSKTKAQGEEQYRQQLINTANLQSELVHQVIRETEQEKQAKLASADAQSQLNSVLIEMNKKLDARDNRHLKEQLAYTEKQIVLETSLAKKKEVVAEKINNIRNRNVKLIEDNETLRHKVEALGKSFDKATTSADFDRINKEIKEVKSSIDIAKSSSVSFFTQLKDNFTKFGSWSIITASYFALLRTLKDSIVQVQELDKALTELKKVTDLSGASLKTFVDDAFNLGEVVGRTGKDVVDATATFARAGYTVKDSLDLAETALIMTNVGDGITDVGKASETLISILKGGQLTIADSAKILDSLNAVSNKNATSFDKLSEATVRYITVSAQAGQTLDQTLGLLTGALEIMGGDSERVGRNLSTLTNRLLGLTDVGDDGYEGISKINTEIMRLTENTSKQVSVFDENTGQLRTAYDILQELSTVYPELSKNAQVYLGNLIAGKNQIQVYNAIMTNFGAVTKATDDSLTSFGSSLKENEEFIGSIEGKTNALKSAWSEFSNNLWSSDVLKFFVDFTTGTIKTVDNIGLLNIALGLLLGYVGGKSALTTGLFNLSGNLFPSLATAMADGSKVALALGTVLNAIPIIALVSGITMLVGKFSEMNVTIDEYAQVVEKTSSKLTELKTKFEQLNASKALTEEDENRLKLLEKEIALNETILNQQKQKQYKMEFEGNISGWDKFIAQLKHDWTFTTGKEQKIIVDIEAKLSKGEMDEAIQQTSAEIRKLMETNEEYNQKMLELDISTTNGTKTFERLNSQVEENNITMSTLMQYMSDWRAKVEDNISGNIGLEDSNKQLLETITSLTNDYLSLSGAVNLATNEIEPQKEAVFSLSEAMNSLSQETSVISGAYGEMSKNGELSISTVSKLISAGDEYIGLLQVENGHYKINQQALEEMFETKKASYIADAIGKQEEIKNNIELAKANLEKLRTDAEAYKSSKAVATDNARTSTQIMNNVYKVAQQIGTALGYTGSALTQFTADTASSVWSNQVESSIKVAEGAIASMQSKYDSLGTSIKVLSNLTLPAYAGTLEKTASAGNKVASSTDKMVDSQKELTQELDKAKQKLDDIVGKYESLKDAIVGVIDADIAKLGSFTFVDTLAGQYEIFKDYLLQGLEEEMKAIEEKADAEKQYWQDKIDALEQERKQEAQNKKLEEARLKIAEAQDALDKAKANRESLQKNTRVFKGGEGWTFDFDPKAVENANNAIKDAQDKLEEAKKNEQEVKDNIAFENAKERYEAEIAEIEKHKQAKLESVQAQIDAMNKLAESWGNNSDEILAEILRQTDAEAFMKQWETANQAEREALLVKFSQAYKTNVDGQILTLTQQKEDFLTQYEQMRQELGLFSEVELFVQEFEKASYETRQGMLAKFTEDFKAEYKKQQAVIEDLEDSLERIIRLQAQVAGAASSLAAAKAEANKPNPSNTPSKKPTGTSGGGGAQNTTSKYAEGGTRLVDYTGKEKNGSGAWFDGTSATPEVILNNTDAGRLYDLIHNKTVPVGDSITNNGGTSIVIQKMEVSAESVDSLDSFVSMLSQKAITSQ